MPGRSARLRLVLASTNPGKAAEIVEIMGDRVELLPRPSSVAEVVEDADTFEGNARLKAAALVAATGEAALADDSGLVVDHLGGAPGVRSARYAGDDASDADNVAKLLAELDGVPEARRTARFCCVIVVRWPDGHELVANGEVEGRITTAPRGDHGFGYDPVFVPGVAADDDGDERDGDGRTFAELSAAEKHVVSHRGRALEALLAGLA